MPAPRRRRAQRRLPIVSQAFWPGLAAGLVIFGAIGCATQKTQPAQPAAPLPGVEACFSFLDQHYQTVYLDDWSFILKTSTQQNYLLKLSEPFSSLQSPPGFGFEHVEHKDQLCKGDYMIGRGATPRHILIDALRALQPGQDEELLAAAKAAAKRSGAAKP
jgi:hypothetical protein